MAGTASATVQASDPTATCSYDNSGYEGLYLCGSNIYATAGSQFSGPVATFQLSQQAQEAGTTDTSATIDWGDGTTTSTDDGNGDVTIDNPSGPNGDVSGSHTYASPGLYTVTISAYGCSTNIQPQACGTAQADGTASVDAPGSTTPSSISVHITPDSPADGNYTITATALDGSGNVMTGYNDAAPNWDDTDSELAGQTPAAFVDGVSTTTGVVFGTPEHGDRVSVGSGGITGTSAPFSVAGPLSQFVIALSTPRTAGQPFTVTIKAEDSAGNVLTSYAGTPTWSDTSGQLSGSPAAFKKGVSTNQVTFANPVSHDNITVDDSNQGVSTTSPAFHVNGALSKFVIGLGAPRMAGQPFTVTITAEDSAGNVLTSYAGTPTWSDTSGQLSGSPAAFTKGVSTNQVTFANPVSHDHITVVDDSAQSVTSQSPAFSVAAPHSTCNWDSTNEDAVYQCGTDFNATAGTTSDPNVAIFEFSNLGQQQGVSINSATIKWGDGTTTSTDDGNSDVTITNPDGPNGNVSGSHTYASPGTYTVTVTSSGCTAGQFPICGTVTSNAIATVTS